MTLTPSPRLFWAETTLQAPSYPPGPVSLAPSGLWGCPGGAALQTRTYLALMVLLEVTLREIGFSSFYLVLGRNPGWRRTALSQRRWRLSSNPFGSRKYGGCSRGLSTQICAEVPASPSKYPRFWGSNGFSRLTPKSGVF